MPTVYTYEGKCEQTVHVTFTCEYCDHHFTVSGKLAASAKAEKWITARAGEAGSELRQKLEHKLQMARGLFEENLKRGVFIHNYNSEGKVLRFEKRNECPACGYYQKMADPPPATIKVKILRGVVGIGCAWFVLLIYLVVLVGLIRGVESEMSPYAIPILIGVPLLVILGALALRNPNRSFMKRHGIKKEDLPPPRSPEIKYGAITATR